MGPRARFDVIVTDFAIPDRDGILLLLAVDLAMVHYALALRMQGWIGDLAVRIEHEFFGDDAFTEW